jgi:hypothetical protein
MKKYEIFFVQFCGDGHIILIKPEPKPQRKFLVLIFFYFLLKDCIVYSISQ